MLKSSVASIFNAYFNNDVFNYASFKTDVTTLRDVFGNYHQALNDVINNVASITTLDSDEYFRLTNIRFEYDYTLDLFDTVFSQLNDNLLGCSLLISIVADLSEQLEKVNEMLTMIEERLDSGELKNLCVVDLLQTVWNRYDEELALFSYSNLTEQALNSQPWLVVDTTTDLDGVAYIHSFPSKVEALKFIMRNGLKHNSLVCRY